MWKTWAGAALALSGIGTIVALPIAARAADTYPYQGKENFHLDGRVDKVDSERDTIDVVARDGRRYTVDTTDAKIRLPRGGRNAETGDLVTGMRVSLDGRLLSDSIVAADTLSVEGAQPDRPTLPVPPRRTSGSTSTNAHSYRQQPIEIRGTVVKVDDDRGLLVVHVNDHERTVMVDDRTDLRGVPGGDEDHIGVSVGDRLTVRGLLRTDGVVYANALSLGRTIDGALPGDVNTDHLLVGRVSQTTNRQETKDLKVHISGDRDVNVIVPSGVPVLRDGRRIALRDLSKNDTIRVAGAYDGDDFRADKIEVLAGRD